MSPAKKKKFEKNKRSKRKKSEAGRQIVPVVCQTQQPRRRMGWRLRAQDSSLDGSAGDRR